MDEKEFINSFHKIYVDQAIEIVETRLEGMDKALSLKTVEIDRRLEEHNKLREEVLTDRDQFVKLETYTIQYKDFSIWKSVVNEQLTKLMTSYENKTTKANWIAIIAILVTIVNFVVLLMFFNKS